MTQTHTKDDECMVFLRQEPFDAILVFETRRLALMFVDLYNGKEVDFDSEQEKAKTTENNKIAKEPNELFYDNDKNEDQGTEE